jgi:hypothetical protein
MSFRLVGLVCAAFVPSYQDNEVKSSEKEEPGQQTSRKRRREVCVQYRATSCCGQARGAGARTV